MKIISLLLLIPIVAWSGKVRTVYMDEQSLQMVNLELGKSTILSFLDKPNRTILGNQNYFNIEFTGSDIAIQPQANIKTNFFVYTGYSRFAFTLNSTHNGTYDDVVYVRRKPKSTTLPPNPQKSTSNVVIQPKTDEKRLKDSSTKLTLHKLIYDKQKQLLIIDFSVTESRKRELQSNKIVITRGNSSIPTKTVIFQKDRIDPNETVPGRIIMSPQNKPFSIKYEGQKVMVEQDKLKEIFR